MTPRQRTRILEAVIKYGTAKFKAGLEPSDTAFQRSDDALQIVIGTLFAVSDELEQEAAS